MASESLSDKSHKARDGFNSLIDLLSKETDENTSLVSAANMADALERFTLWAGNLGAFKQASNKLSLDTRLAGDPEIRDSISRQLDYLLEAFEDCRLFDMFNHGARLTWRYI